MRLRPTALQRPCEALHRPGLRICAWLKRCGAPGRRRRPARSGRRRPGARRRPPRPSRRCRCRASRLGTTTRSPRRSPSSSSRARSAEFAATPPPITTVVDPGLLGRAQQLRRRARRPPRPGTTPRRRRTDDLGVLADVLHDRGLESREREVVAVVEHRTRERDRVGGRRRARAGRSPDRPDSRARGSARPCRTPRRPRRRRSGRAPGSARGRPSRSSSVWPPETISVTQRRLERRVFEQRRVDVRLVMVARRRTARAVASAIALAALTPTSSAPASPGPWTAATASISCERGAGLDAAPRSITSLIELDVRAARDLGNHAAVARVQVDLARHDRRPHDAAVVDDRGRGLVARRLDDRGCAPSPALRTLEHRRARARRCSSRSSSAAYVGLGRRRAPT